MLSRRISFCLFSLVLVMVLAGQVLAAAPSKVAEPKVDSELQAVTTWAEIELKGSYPEGAQTPGLFGDITESLADVIARLEKASADKKISGVILKIKNPSLGGAKRNELRQAIMKIREKGKKVYAYLDSGMSGDYLIASACDKIIMPESGALMILGMRAEVTFYKTLFDKIGLKADMLRVGEFKSAGEPYTRTEMSEPFRREMEELLDDRYRQMVDAISKGRKLERKEVASAIDSGPFTAVAAKKLKLIDHIAYDDELESLVLNGSDAELKLVRRYGKKKLDTDFSGFTGMVKMMNLLMGIEPVGRRSGTSKIAVIHASGMIMGGRSASDMFGGQTLGSDTFVKAVRKASADDSVKAIVLRVDSPGGSALASDLMWRALQKVEKPVVVSMGDVAASGGYYISMGASRIFAEPGTITGSIGVVGGKVALRGLYDKIGISTSVISRGKNSGTLSTLDGFSESEKQAMTKMLYEIYDQFTKKAAAGRKMEHADLEKLARGRVYTGAMALKVGLVDELGTLEDAVAHAGKLAGLNPDDKIERMILPRPTSPFEQLFGPIDPDAKASAPQAEAIVEALKMLSPELAQQLNGLSVIQLLSKEPALTLMPFRITVK